MKKLVLAALFVLSGCTAPDEAARVLTSMGFTQVTVTGYNAFACSEDDVFHTGFTARSPTGQFVSGTVCSGWLKGATVRF